ncbi:MULTISPECIES: glutamine-hydrolyzing GMP synthase [Vibrio]|uniref:GMP synthase [glutamine-hydrolyzing] n=4 Tax=Vibrio cyclitrophicus TaxID=47951 RepID=A0A7Z1S366_9VIBR|nr:MULTISPECIES: glutamine-hydrolyzing GMP synthase [Vibrio]KNH12038.1 GMP synthase [Vibrio lentus]MBY7661428.1 glutamine-hydrolyzing GMP synthase [Vibrio atlanticus]ERM61729.1 GMP synthase [glutamine-hydrolyzing], amidotransferase subunit / GMP synthase [glutamine-hydrolyzing], ATP pyrophosphatase subunit [Vibrio cyclitrophicus FF75]KAA8598645.1 GMP synthase [glutamine-hydrolyzing] amidotransferase subunit [Vibrio cyclitrophicus]MBE8555840.1 glutamine-hydrolyzing GMP synthase [Vibrio sp. OPT2
MTKNIHDQRILILDFGSQYTQLVARRIREIGVYCELWSWDVEEADIREFNPDGIILSGGPESVTEENSPRAPQYVFDSGVPVFGICYGMQTMAEQLGGKVATSTEREFGYAAVQVTGESALFADLETTQDVWMSHGDKVVEIPADFTKIAETDTCPYAAMANEDKKYYGVQFHPEVTHTKNGLKMLENFVLNACGCEGLWTPASIIEDAVARIKEQVGDDEVILGLSGGVDSSVVAMLAHRAIGDKLTCVFVDNGLLRLNEGEQVMEMFGNKFGLNIIKVDAEERFLNALEGEAEPEAKRKIIGHVFVDIFDEESKKLKNAKWLAQGTIYPDVIESAASKTGKAHVIKSHHNVGGLPDDMEMGLVEPLRELFKDEVRKIGLELGLPYNMLYRHPFPGPGLGVRVLGEVKKEYCDLLRRADAIFIEELHAADLYHKVSQAFTVFLPVRSVGVMGDGRKYDWVVSLRAVETIDFMTAHWAHLPYDFLGKVSNRIINEVNGISRVVYDISGKPPATIEWE